MTWSIGPGVRSLARAGVVAAALAVATGTTAAEATTIRVANFTNASTLPLYYGMEKGYFKDAGINVEIVKVATGAASVAAVASGAADIGWAASAVPIFARGKGVKVKMFMTASDDGPPDHYGLSIDATKRSGVTSFAQMKGKTVMINAFGTATELSVRIRIQRAGVNWDDVKKVVVPFPQMPAALELGNADVGAMIQPMQSQVVANKAIGAIILGRGVLPESKHRPITVSSFFATDAWLAKSEKAALAFGRAYLKAAKELRANDKLRVAQLVKVTGMKPAMAAIIPDPTWFHDLAITKPAVEPNYADLVESGMLKTKFNVDDVIATLPF
ncbi:MAG TPA: ABC transporter substrate-binding protein [Hyphomicrobiales bacterium]|nr:ABC transporter substrate-binding protein [Hyphomicrobiales bacterium]